MMNPRTTRKAVQAMTNEYNRFDYWEYSPPCCKTCKFNIDGPFCKARQEKPEHPGSCTKYIISEDAYIDACDRWEAEHPGWTVSDSMYFEETAGRSVKSFLYTIVQCLQDVQQSIDDLNDSIESMCEGKNES